MMTARIKKLFKKAAVLAIACAAVISPVSVQAAGKKSPCAFVKVAYANDILLKKGDIFDITYAEKGSKDTNTLKIDAWASNQQLKAISAPEGTYEIKKITYEGNNKAVKDAGYTCSPSFTSSSDKNKGTTIYIGVGDDAETQITAAYPNSIVVKGLAEKNDGNDSADETGGTDTNDKKNSENTDANTQNSESQNTDQKVSSADINIKQKKKNTNKNKNSSDKFQQTVFSFFKRLIYLAIILVAGLIVLFKLHKDKYI